MKWIWHQNMDMLENIFSMEEDEQIYIVFNLDDDHEVVAIEGRPSIHGSQWLSSLAAGERWLTAEDTPDLILEDTPEISQWSSIE